MNLSDESYSLNPIGVVRSPLHQRKDAPKQPPEGAPEAWLEIYPQFAEALEGITPGAEIIVLTFLHEAKRDVLKVRPRGNPQSSITGVFNTRSPDRPNPIGMHTVKVLEIEADRSGLRVDHLEAIDGTPILDIKPVFCGFGE